MIDYLYFMRIYYFLIALVFYNPVMAQHQNEAFKNLGNFYIVKLASAPFPHPDRANGHIYQGQLYSAKQHYNDSSVAIFIPKDFKLTSQTDFVIYFHGWRNNIDSACTRFRLIEQFSESKVNSIFVFPEGPRNAPDSHGGKLEETNGLKNLISDVQTFLSDSAGIRNTKIGHIILAGHSGAYRVISFCLEHGGLADNISAVLLFDALYGRTEIFLQWIKNYNRHLVDIYTDKGGTKAESENLMQQLDSLNIPYIKLDEAELTEDALSKNKRIFIHSDLVHNQVIAERNQFLLFIKTSLLNSSNKF